MKKRPEIVIALLIIIILLAATRVLYFPPITARVTAASSKWNIQTVDPNATIGGLPSIALDSLGNPHIAYYSDSGKSLMYASRNGSSWNLQTVATFPMKYFLLTCDLALDSSNNPHIVYNGQDGLMYTSWNGAKWSIQTVDPNGEEGSLALDSAGNPHITYITVDAVKYASWDSSNWNIQTIESNITGEPYPTAYIYSSLVLDSNNLPHVLYGYAQAINYPSYDWTLKYAVWNGSSWNTQTVIPAVYPATSAFVWSIGNIALDSNGNSHFTYVTSTEGVNGILYYESWNGKAWTAEKVESLSVSTNPASLALNSHNTPIMTYYDFGVYSNNGTYSTARVMFTKWTGSSFSIQTVDTQGIATTALSLDSKGTPNIVYAKQGELMYATTAENSHASTSPTVPEFSSLIVLIILLAILLPTLLVYFKKHKNPHTTAESYLYDATHLAS